jgi:hypothetical protein
VLTCLSRGTGVQAGAIFDVRALPTPPLAAERMIRTLQQWVFVQKCLLDRKRSSLTEKGLFSRKAARRRPNCSSRGTPPDLPAPGSGEIEMRR